MQANSFLKIWLLSVNFEKFTSIIEYSDQSQSSVWTSVIDWSRSYFYRGKFLKANGQQVLFRNDFVLIHMISVKLQLKLLGATFLLLINSV